MARTLRTEVDLPNPEGKLLPGLYVDVTITVEHRDVWALPASAVVTKEDESFCYRWENGKAVRTPLRLGLSGGGLVEVLKIQLKPVRSGGQKVWEDVTGKEEIITSNLSAMTDGQAVVVSHNP